MRFAAPLHTSRKHHILKNPAKHGVITLAWFLVALVIILLFVNVSNLDAPQLFGGFMASLARTTVAYVVAVTLALIVAVLITINITIENLLLPVFDVLQSFPSFALFPVLIHSLKHEPEAIIIGVLVITMIWPILFSIIGGIKNRRQDLEEAATIFGAHGFNRLHYFTLPELLPSIITGSIVGWGEGWEFIIGAELLVSVHSGIGRYLGYLGDTSQNSLLAFGIIVLMLMLFIINKIIWLPLLHDATQFETES